MYYFEAAREDCRIKLRSHTATNRTDFVSWCMLYAHEGITKCIREKMTLYFMGEPVNHIYQDTKSTRLIAVCKNHRISIGIECGYLASVKKKGLHKMADLSGQLNSPQDFLLEK